LAERMCPATNNTPSMAFVPFLFSLMHTCNCCCGVAVASGVPKSDGVDAADAPNSDGVVAADAPNSDGPDAADAPNSDGVDAAGAPNSDGVDAAEVPNSDGVLAAGAPKSDGVDAAGVPNSDGAVAAAAGAVPKRPVAVDVGVEKENGIEDAAGVPNRPARGWSDHDCVTGSTGSRSLPTRQGFVLHTRTHGAHA
jgi:hypothetical protein